MVAQLVTLAWVGQLHNFSKDMGLAAQQVSISRPAAVVGAVGRRR